MKLITIIVFQADDLLYCYRWLLLEMKREFAFNDALIMLEVMWSSLPPNPPQGELPLYDVKFEPPAPADLPPNSPSPSPRENQYTKVCAIRRQTTSATSSPFKLNATMEESNLAMRRKQTADTRIISTNGIVKSNAQPLSQTLLTQHSTVQSPVPQTMVQKLSQLTKENIHRSLEKINTQGAEYANHMLNRKGSLKLQTSAALNTTSTKIVRNLNEFLNFSKNITMSNGDAGHRDRLSKQISLDERGRREHCEERRASHMCGEAVQETCDTTHTKHSNPPKSARTLQKEIQEVEDCLAKKIEAIPQTVNAQVLESSPEDDDSSEYFPMTSSITLELRQELENLNKHVLEDPVPCIPDDIESGFESTQDAQPQYAGDEIFIWENPLDESKDTALPQSCSQHSMASLSDNSYSSTTSGADSVNSCDSTPQIREVQHVINSRQVRVGLPPPNEFGGGNPFLMFLCISVLCQHSEHIMSHQMDYNEMAIYFDKMIRKHNVHKVLNEARKRYESYLCNYRQMSRQSQHHSPRV